MNQEEATRLVKETFGNAFDRKRFVGFVKNLLNEINQDENILFDASVPDSYNEYVKSYERIGQYIDPEEEMLDVLSVNLRKETSPVRARTMQRNFIGWYLRNVGYSKDNALVAFYHENVEDWRFSYVKRDYLSEKDKTGKIKAREELTPAKRFSFLVGKNEPSHTAQNQIVPILRNDKGNPTILDIETAFNIETVTDEFFKEYRNLFLRLKESLDDTVKRNEAVKTDFESKKINSADFAKKLLSQIVFLYFLQKKGWFGVKRGKKWGSGSKNFLRELFKKEHTDYENFFNDILEPLFYEALRVEHPGDYYKHFDCRIPFLNGGLFDPINNYDWVETEIHLPDEVFCNNETTKGDKGNGIFDIFDRYNFTVKEDEPLEKEVAVDPEMLGKVFENLLEVKDRKSKGTYYTPREIVHYMCQESLVNYLNTKLGNLVGRDNFEKLIKYGDFVFQNNEEVLENTSKPNLPRAIRENARLIDEKLSLIRICDPAVGSGAFVVGMMNEIVRTRDALTRYIRQIKERNPYNFKREAIQNCLYGVDIDPGAVEIAKLRLWLSLVVDEHDRETVKPLPNLDYKIVQGNSLLGFPYPPQGLEKIEELKLMFFAETSSGKKDQLREDIDKAITQQLASTERSLGHKVNFDFKIFFSEVFHKKHGFDVLIGNPPYVQLQKLKDDPIREVYKKAYKTYEAKGDLYCLFYEKGVDITCDKGVLCYISSNKWMRAGYGKKLREFFLKYNPRILIDLGPGVFKSATVDANIIVIQKARGQNLLRGLTLDKKDKSRINDKVSKESDNLSHVTEGPWFIGSEAEVRLKEKIEHIGKPLKEWDITINYGIKTGYNPAFIIDNETKKELINKDPNSAEIIKPILLGNDIRRYHVASKTKWWLLDVHNGYGGIPPVDIDDYEAIKNRMNKNEYYSRLEKRSDKGITPYNLRNCAYHAEFEKRKIIYPETTLSAKFFYDSKGEFFADKTCFIMTGKNLKILLAMLSSNLLFYAYKTFFASVNLAGKGYQYNKHQFEKFPIPQINGKQESQLTDLVDKILTCTQSSDYLQNPANQTDVYEHERQIDELIYNFCELTKEEIRIVENIK